MGGSGARAAGPLVARRAAASAPTPLVATHARSFFPGHGRPRARGTRPVRRCAAAAGRRLRRPRLGCAPARAARAPARRDGAHRRTRPPRPARDGGRRGHGLHRGARRRTRPSLRRRPRHAAAAARRPLLRSTGPRRALRSLRTLGPRAGSRRHRHGPHRRRPGRDGAAAPAARRGHRRTLRHSPRAPPRRRRGVPPDQAAARRHARGHDGVSSRARGAFPRRCVQSRRAHPAQPPAGGDPARAAGGIQRASRRRRAGVGG